MNIRDRQQIRRTASHALQTASGDPKKAALIYAGITCGLTLAANLLSYYLSSEIAGTGGLGNMGLRSILATISALLPIVQMLVFLGLELGYYGIMLDTARGRGADPRHLVNGFYRFGPMLRAVLLQALIYLAFLTVSVYLSVWIFMLLPLSDPFYELAMPLMESLTVLDTSFTLDDATLSALINALIPYYYILILVCAVVLIPVTYKYRMVTFCIADGESRALGALRGSVQMMRRNRFALFRLDLGFWWYYLLQVLVPLVCYLDLLLPMFGISFPWSETVSFFLFLVLSLALQMAVLCLFMNKVTVTYAAAYDALRPRPQSGGVVLGNIFDM